MNADGAVDDAVDGGAALGVRADVTVDTSFTAKWAFAPSAHDVPANGKTPAAPHTGGRSDTLIGCLASNSAR